MSNTMNDETSIGTLMAEQVERLLSREVTRERLIAVEQGTFDTPLWQALEEMGITLALAPESAAGAGLSWQDAEPTLRAAGSWAAPVPLGESLLATWALGSVGLEIPEGPIAVAEGVFRLDHNQHISGTDALVPWIQHCQHLVVVAEQSGQRFVCLLNRDEVSLETVETFARIPSSRVVASGATPVAIAAADNIIGELGLLPALATLRTVQIAGVLDRLLALCVEYGNTREQFGRPIGKFQAIQHLIADMAAQTAAAQVAGLYACRQIDKGNGEYGAAIAKARGGLAATRGAEAAHQIFGAMGFTDENILHYYSRRLWQWRDEAGSEHWWAERLGRRVLAQSGDELWRGISG